jgi:hypothetical protein
MKVLEKLFDAQRAIHQSACSFGQWVHGKLWGGNLMSSEGAEIREQDLAALMALSLYWFVLSFFAV